MFLHVQEIRADGGMCSCASPDDGGCDVNTPCNNYKKENVAYGKQASISSRYSSNINKILSGPACAAVNGRTDPVMKLVNVDGTNCVHTETDDNNPWWQVDLGQSYTVTEIIFYGRTGEVKRLSGIRITIDSQECITLPEYSNYGDVMKTVSCTRPLRGKIVKLSKVDFTDPDIHIINFCEMQIWVCKPGLFGQACSQHCSGHCLNNVACDNLNGTCPNGCTADYYNDSCSERCGQCLMKEACDDDNGHCPSGCETGHQPPMCNKPCENKTYGTNCTEQCGRCENSAACNVFNGSCQACEGNFDLPLCTECMDGYHGNGCRERCGQCADNDVCGKVTGHCPNGCPAGYQPPYCNATCGVNTYGKDCKEQCGQCSNSRHCDAFNGTCKACVAGFSLPMCKECMDGYHGNGCRERCGQCADSDVCGKVTGHCPNGCPAGYQPPYCNTMCEDNRYGKDCKEQCGNCSNPIPCDAFNGTCKACVAGFSLPMCKVSEQSQEDRDQDSNRGGIIGGAIGAVVVVAAAVVVVVLVVRRKRKQKEQSSGSQPTSLQSEHGRGITELPLTSLEETSVKPTAKPSVAVKPFIRPKKSKTENSNAEDSQHIYANAPTTTAQSPPATTTNPPGQAELTQTNETAPEPQSTEEDDEGALDDEAPVYGNVGNVYAMFKATKPELDRVQKYLVDKLASEHLREEFRSIAKTDEDASINVGKEKINIKKNRFAQIIPYDRSRVILTDGYSEGTSTDFVNASYISGYQKERQYIAAQGPRDNTVGDFWRMVWQEKITHIVMLTNLNEHGKPKCELYWPEEESTTETYGPVTVTTTHIQQRDNFSIRSFTVTRDGGRESREVTQYHYVSWPDHGAPVTTSLVRFWRHVTRETKHDTAPLLVHCSAGVGRTGTYIGLDIGMDTAVSVGTIDVIQIVTQLRQERTLMVQAMDQYVFLHQALLEAYTARDTVVPLDQFDVIFPQPINARTPNVRIDKEFKALMQMQPLMSECRHDNATQEINMAKNRSSTALPLDNHIVYLTEHVAERNQYINAVFMPTFRDPKGSILTQLPLQSTLVDFWRLVYGNDVTTIVSLTSADEERKVASYCQYWPRELRKPVKSGPYTVTLQSKSAVFTTLTLYHITVQKTLATQGTTSARSLRVLHYDGWTGEVGGDTSHMLQLVDTLTNTLMEADTATLLIQCCDGVGKSGLFSALCDVISHMTYDREIDIYMTVRHVQNVRPSAVTSLEQYRYCYQVAQQRHRDMSIYANT